MSQHQVPYIGQGSFGVAYASLGKSAPWPCLVGGGVRDPRQFHPNAGSPCVGNCIRGVSRPSNVCASDMIDVSVGIVVAPPSPPPSLFVALELCF
ncbi:hypothetical protein V6N13_082043 [Hibiscus sabdariffa]